MPSTPDLAFVRPSDPVFSAVRELRHRVLYEPYGISSDFDWEDDTPGTCHLVATQDGALVGYARLDLAHKTAQIRHLSVEPSMRGNGVGGLMLGAMIERARESRAQVIFLNARFTALGLYRRYGFVEVGPIFHTEHTFLPHKRMELAIA